MNKSSVHKNVNQAVELGKLTACKRPLVAISTCKVDDTAMLFWLEQNLEFVANHRLPNIDKGEQRGVLESNDQSPRAADSRVSDSL